MRKFLGLVLTGVLLFCTVFSIVGCFGEKSEEEIARNKIERLTGIEIPMDAEIVYHIREEDKFLNGRRFMYTVFQFESEPTDWLNENAFSKEENDEIERRYSGGFDLSPVEKEEIPEKFLPDFKEEYYPLLTENFVYFVYIPRDCMLTVLIPGH